MGKKVKKFDWTPTKFSLWAAISASGKMVANTLGPSRRICADLTSQRIKERHGEIPLPVSYVTVIVNIEDTPANRKRLGVGAKKGSGK